MIPHLTYYALNCTRQCKNLAKDYPMIYIYIYKYIGFNVTQNCHALGLIWPQTKPCKSFSCTIVKTIKLSYVDN